MADNFDQTLVDVEGDVDRCPFRRVRMRSASIYADRLGGDSSVIAESPNGWVPIPTRVYVPAEDLADADLFRARRLVLVADHPQGHHVHRSSSARARSANRPYCGA